MNSATEKTGVFICHCGGNISDIINIETVKKEIHKSDNIKFFNYDYLCSNIGQNLIKKSAYEHSLNKIVIGACTPSKHDKLFKKCARECNINQSFVEIANLREQCSWVHTEEKNATEKAINLIQSKIERLKYSQPLSGAQIPINANAMVIGGGIAGITAAINLANNGIRTYIVEKETSIGGNVARIGKIFSPEKLAEECAMCSLSPLMNEIEFHDNITLYSHSEIEKISGNAGNFVATIRKKARYVNDSCMACGKCSEVCPVIVENQFNCGARDKKAISLKFAQAVPQTYNISRDHCRELNGIKCRRCFNACRIKAIDFDQKDETIEIETGTIITSTGFEEYDASKKAQYGYGRYDNVVTQMELARILGINGPTGGKLLKPSDEKIPENIVMIQCVGSRDEKPSANKYCSRYCCMAALKHASLIKKKYPDSKITICYIDIRAFGMYENYYREVQNIGISFIRGRPAEIVQKPDKSLVVKVEDTLTQRLKDIKADLVVLSAAMEPSQGTKSIASKLGTATGEDGFIRERHSKLKPVDTSKDGIFVCGTAQAPKDITDTIAQAGLAAARAREFISAGVISLSPETATINYSICDHCGQCLKCPFDAIWINDSGKIEIDQVACKGCGYCTGQCPSDAIHIEGYTNRQIMAEVEGLLEKNDILVFASSNIAYTTIDSIGNSALKYPSEIKVIRVPTTTIVNQLLISHAFRQGASEVLLLEDPPDSSLGAHIFPLAESNFEKLKQDLDYPDNFYFKKAYIPYYSGICDVFNSLVEKRREHND
ncbi:fumarate reductase/succinate dehydrogenase flavoprotein domain protein [Methanosalsum zhilinae DSM 4017]|uniref:CoB--CoM heterodisulfide reductase iron-sulfur subunit A n=1 Tax=Methanosalsum zhilinae (strain DSM 4017 / NBRC 107636 / OCM 62 / WeN5) TaxID=679901 RepID=F7XKJ1_METZD|nr:ferredoxin:CoB-CoM heterodisulfide reductase subunit HdrA [Methanosalsum zhilinae]AEH60594.1 fumarate reductase/succinate dehydrogenase flavoprotein domain protein [Methanosalsum zhilinae DSM 4017]